MLRPSYTELMETLNRESDVDSKITSRYTIVIAAAKRARQLIDGADPLTYAPTDRAVSTAVKEMQEGMISIRFSENTEYNVISSGMAYTDYEGSYGEEAFQSKKTIDYAMDKSDQEVALLDYGMEDESVHEDYDEEDEEEVDNIDYSQSDIDYEDNDVDQEIEVDEDYQDQDEDQ